MIKHKNRALLLMVCLGMLVLAGDTGRIAPRQEVEVQVVQDSHEIPTLYSENELLGPIDYLDELCERGLLPGETKGWCK